MRKLLLILMLVFSLSEGVYAKSNGLEATYDIGQNHIINQIDHYLATKGREAPATFKSGLCNGLAFLAQYYASLDQEEDFFQALQLFSKWDGTQESLQEAFALFGSASNLEQLFEQWINDLVWFQHIDIQLTSSISLNLSKQSKRILQYEMVKSDDREICMLLSPFTFHEVTLKQFEENLEIWSCFPNTVLEFGGRNHATSARVLENGHFSYYDPNDTHRQPRFNAKDLAYYIQETKYKRLGVRSKQMEIELMAYQYLPKGEKPELDVSTAQKKKWKSGKNSPNRYTPLHLALFANDLESFHTLLKSHDPNANTLDFGVTPLAFATLMWRSDFIEDLLQHPEIDVYETSAGGLSPLEIAVNNLNLDATVLLLNFGADLFVTAKEKLGFAEIVAIIEAKKGNGLMFFSIPAVLICTMHHPKEFNFIRELSQRVPELVEMQDTQGNTLLHAAAMFANKELMNLLIEIGVKLDVKNAAGKTAAELIQKGTK